MDICRIDITTYTIMNMLRLDIFIQKIRCRKVNYMYKSTFYFRKKLRLWIFEDNIGHRAVLQGKFSNWIRGRRGRSLSYCNHHLIKFEEEKRSGLLKTFCNNEKWKIITFEIFSFEFFSCKISLCQTACATWQWISYLIST